MFRFTFVQCFKIFAYYLIIVQNLDIASRFNNLLFRVLLLDRRLKCRFRTCNQCRYSNTLTSVAFIAREPATAAPEETRATCLRGNQGKLAGWLQPNDCGKQDAQDLHLMHLLGCEIVKITLPKFLKSSNNLNTRPGVQQQQGCPYGYSY